MDAVLRSEPGAQLVDSSATTDDEPADGGRQTVAGRRWPVDGGQADGGQADGGQADGGQADDP